LPLAAYELGIIRSDYLNGKQRSLFLKVMIKAEKFIKETYCQEIWELTVFYMDPSRYSKNIWCDSSS